MRELKQDSTVRVRRSWRATEGTPEERVKVEEDEDREPRPENRDRDQKTKNRDQRHGKREQGTELRSETGNQKRKRTGRNRGGPASRAGPGRVEPTIAWFTLVVSFPGRADCVSVRQPHTQYHVQRLALAIRVKARSPSKSCRSHENVAAPDNTRGKNDPDQPNRK